jgi:arylsulfatase A-like enzyme
MPREYHPYEPTARAAGPARQPDSTPKASLSRLAHIGVLLAFACLLMGTATSVFASDRPSIVILFADDISARELPLYGSSVWSPPESGDTSDPKFRAQTPSLDRLAQEGCWIKTAWASVVCSPSRAMMMTGRYAHLHKWWGNKSKGTYVDEHGKTVTWPLYESSPTQIGHVAQQAGYKTYWSGKTQMAGDLRRFGFDQGCFTPGNLEDRDNPYTDFKLVDKKVDGEKLLFNADTDTQVDTYKQHGWYWFPHVRLMNHDGKDFQWYPNTPEAEAEFGVTTYGPDVELDFVFDFMEKRAADNEPFFVYHTSHLGHDAFNWLDPDSPSKWPGTPVIHWDGEKYVRTNPKIAGDAGDYDTHGTVTGPGIHNHVNYLDYQVWQYQQKLKNLGIADNTIFIFCSDNGTSGYGKNSTDRQKGVHVPMIISAPGLTKRGEQNVLVNLCDILPTIAELTGIELPSAYEMNGESLVPFLFSDQATHREWLYGYKDKEQIIRGTKVMRDGRGKWWDVSSTPDDLISFPMITDWEKVSAEHRAEREKLDAILPAFSQQKNGRNAPGGGPKAAVAGNAKVQRPDASAFGSQKGELAVVFQDDFEGRESLGAGYTTARGMNHAWAIRDGVLIGTQTSDDHGAVMRKAMDFDDLDVEFDFRFSGGTRFNFVIDDKKERSVHSGHICRVSVSPQRISISDDKTGSMNLEVRAQRQAKDLSEAQVKSLEELLQRTQASGPVKLESGQWYKLRVRIKGDIMKASLDGQLVAKLLSPGIDHPTKTQFGMTVNGTTIDFDNLKVFDANGNQAQ